VSVLAAQWAGNSSSQSIQVQVDGVPVSTFIPADTNYASFTSDNFTVTAGAHTVSFVGIDPDGQENIAFLDQVGVNSGGMSPGDHPTGGTGHAHSQGEDPWLAVALSHRSDSVGCLPTIPLPA
jgi:hypothetical protein